MTGNSHGPTDIETRPFTWKDTTPLDHVSAYWAIMNECDLISAVQAVDAVGGGWDVKIGVARVVDGPDVVIASCPARGWAVWCLSDDGIAFVHRTILRGRFMPIPMKEWP